MWLLLLPSNYLPFNPPPPTPHLGLTLLVLRPIQHTIQKIHQHKHCKNFVFPWKESLCLLLAFKNALCDNVRIFISRFSGDLYVYLTSLFTKICTFVHKRAIVCSCQYIYSYICCPIQLSLSMK